MFAIAGTRGFTLAVRTDAGIVSALNSPTDDVPAAAQAALDEFLVTVTDFCGVPLSNVTLAQLDEYVEAVVKAALNQ